MSGAKFPAGAAVTVYERWPGIIRGEAKGGQYVVQYAKRGNNIVGFVPASRLKAAPTKGKP